MVSCDHIRCDEGVTKNDVIVRQYDSKGTSMNGNVVYILCNCQSDKVKCVIWPSDKFLCCVFTRYVTAGTVTI